MGLRDLVCKTTGLWCETTPTPSSQPTIHETPSTYDTAPPGQNQNHSAGSGRISDRPTARLVK